MAGSDFDQEHRRLKAIIGDLCREIKSSQLATSRSTVETQLRRLRSDHLTLRAEWELFRRAHEEKANFNPNQPRLPAGGPDGGQWTDEGGGTTRVRAADARITLTSPVMSDALPDPVIPGVMYAQTRIDIETSALTGISTIDDTTKKLTSTLVSVLDVVEHGPNLTPQAYGSIVHTAFAAAVRIQALPGIGFSDVETTFGGDYYGSKGSIRTDVVLRNDIGDVIAIYDVKTGESGIDPARAAQLRAKTGGGLSVPVIELSIRRGVTGKQMFSGSQLLIRAAWA